MSNWENHHSPSPGEYEEYPEPTNPAEQEAEMARAEQLNTYIERLRMERRPNAPLLSSTDEADAYPMAALFRAAAPGAADPNPAFLNRLLAQLPASQSEGAPATKPADEHDEAPLPLRLHTTDPRARRVSRPRKQRNGEGGVSRRGLLAGGLGAAAAAVVGGAVGAALEHASQPNGPSSPPSQALVPEGEGVWVAVAPVSAIPLGKVHRFQTNYIVGFIRHTEEGFSALSGVCTHMSCFLNWNVSARTFDCPCHGGRFTEDGKAAASSPIRYSPLPAIRTKVEQDQVWVYVLPPNANGGSYTTGATPTPSYHR